MCVTIVSIAGTVSEKQTDCCLAQKNKDNVCIITVDLYSQYKYKHVTCFVKFPFGEKNRVSC